MKNFQIIPSDQSPPCKDSNLEYKPPAHHIQESFLSPTYPSHQNQDYGFQTSSNLNRLPLNLSSIQRPLTVRSSASSESSENVQLMRMALRQKFNEIDSISVRSRNQFEESDTQSILANIHTDIPLAPQPSSFRQLDPSQRFFLPGPIKNKNMGSPKVNIHYPSEDSTTLNLCTEENVSGVVPPLALRERSENLAPLSVQYESKTDGLDLLLESQLRNRLNSGVVSERIGKLEQRAAKENMMESPKAFTSRNFSMVKIHKKLEETLEENQRLADKLASMESSYKGKMNLLVMQNQNLSAALGENLDPVSPSSFSVPKRYEEMSFTHSHRGFKDMRFEDGRYWNTIEAQKDIPAVFLQTSSKKDDLKRFKIDISGDLCDEGEVDPKPQLVKAREGISELNISLQMKTRENECLKQKIEKLEDIIKGKSQILDHTISGMHEENEFLQGQLKSKEKENEVYKNQIKEKEDEVQKVIQQLNEIQSNSLIRASQSAELRSRFTSVMIENDKLNQANQRLLKENENLKEKLLEITLKYQQEIKPPKSHATTQCDEALTSQENAKEEMEAAEKKIVMLSLELFRLRSALQDKSNENQRLQELVKKHKRKSEGAIQLTSRIDFMSNLLEKIQKDSGQYIEGFSKLQEKHNELQGQVFDSTVTHDVQLKSIVDTLMQDKEKLTNLLQDKLKELEENRVYSNRLNDRISTLIVENDRLNKVLTEKLDDSTFNGKEVEEIKHKQSLYAPRSREAGHLNRTMSSDFSKIAPKMQIKDVITTMEETITPKAFRKSMSISRPVESETQKYLSESFQGKIDVVFCVDCTRSMSPYINILSQVYANIKTKVSQEIGYLNPDIRFGFVGYREHAPYNGNTWVTKVQDLDTFENILEFLEGIETKPSPDNDFPEAVMPGLWDCVDQINWRNDQNGRTVRIIFHIGDAPPHGELYYKGKFDHFPKGDPSGITIEKVAQKLEELKISYKLLRVGKYLDMMEKVFKENISDIEVLRLENPELLEELTLASINGHFERLGSQISTHDKKFLNQKPRGLVRRSPKMGICYSTSLAFDDYLFFLQEKQNSKAPSVKTIILYSTANSIVGIQCIYSTKSEEFEGPLHAVSIENTKKTIVKLDTTESLCELSVNISEKGNICGLTILNSSNKLVKVGGKSLKKLECFLPGNKYTLVGIGGSFKKTGIDSLYFYYT